MTWFVFALTGAFCTALHQVFQKISAVRGADNIHVSLAYVLGPSLVIPYLFAVNGCHWLLIHGWGNLHFWLYALLNSVCGYFAVRFAVEANRHTDATLLAAGSGLNALVITIPPLFMLGERMTAGGWLATVLIIAGAVVTGLACKGVASPAANDNRRGIRYFVAALPFYAFMPTLIKLMMREGGAAPSVTAGTSCLVMLLVMLAVDCRGIVKPAGGSWLALLMVAALALIGGVLTNAAMDMTTVGNAMAIKKMSPLFLFAFGVVVFRERDRLSLRLAALALMLGGGAVMYLAG